MSDHIRAEKQHWRQHVKQIYSQTNVSQRQEWSLAVCKKLSKHSLFTKAHHVLLFHSLSDEIQTNWILENFSQEKQLYLPCVDGDQLMICPYNVTQCQTGSYGIQEPSTDPIDHLDILDLIIIPGVAFDSKGGRLGRGKGFYDRFLEQVNVPLIGVCFPYQLVDQLPTETHDKKIPIIITPHQIITL